MEASEVKALGLNALGIALFPVIIVVNIAAPAGYHLRDAQDKHA